MDVIRSTIVPTDSDGGPDDDREAANTGSEEAPRSRGMSTFAWRTHVMVQGDAAAGRLAATNVWTNGLGTVIEPAHVTREYADAALDKLTALVAGRSAIDKASAEGSERGAESLSDDPLQGLTEIIQNADDQAACTVSIALQQRDDGHHLLVVHDGRPVELDHAVAMAFPWITTKAGDAAATGRFGIGLKTLNVLGGPLQVHCHPYHFELRDQTILRVAPAALAHEPHSPRGRRTLLDLPLTMVLTHQQVGAWLEGLGSAGLLFLNHVRSIVLLPNEAGEHGLEIWLRAVGPAETVRLGCGESAVQAESLVLEDREGSRWTRLTFDAPVARDLRRHHKATGERTSVAIALHAHLALDGRIHAALPIASTGLPFSLNAQFDPDAARRNLLDRPWNQWLFEQLARLVAAAAMTGLTEGLSAAWATIPMTADTTSAASNALAEALVKHFIQPTQQFVLEHARVPSPDRPASEPASLGELDYEEPLLTGILGDEEVRQLIGSDTVVLTEVQRDTAGRWRAVLSELGIEPSVTVKRSLSLFDATDTAPRPPSLYAHLAAVAHKAGLATALAETRCVVLADGSRTRPPAHGDAHILVEHAGVESLTTRLGLAHQVDPAYLEAAPSIRDWLTVRGSLVATHESAEALTESLSRVASPIELDKNDLRDLRDAFDRLPEDRRRRLAPLVGRRILISGRTAQANRWIQIKVKPAEAYLPGGIEHTKDSWARAAGKTEGLLWIAPELEDVLRGAPRETSGAGRFLRLLGASTAPRLVEPAGAEQRFSRSPARVVSLARWIPRPALQQQQVDAPPSTDATHLLGDRVSPDLAAVCRDISRASRQDRPARARALLATLSRAWDRELSEHATASAVHAYDGYFYPRRTVIAAWLADLASVSWLPTARGSARRPGDLAVRTPATELVYGADPSGFVHSKVHDGLRVEVLRAIGIRLDPGASTLVERLRNLCDAEAGASGPSPADPAAEAGVLYRLLARHARVTQESGTSKVDDLTVAQLKAAFSAKAGLIRTTAGWCRPDQVLRGQAIFGQHRPFAPGGEGMVPLWRSIGIREPGMSDCVAVLREIATRSKLRAEDEGVLLEAFNLLAGLAARAPAEARRMLRTVPLWSGAGWLRRRPVAVVDDVAIADALGSDRQVWHPPGPLARFEPLLGALGVTKIDTATLESTPAEADAQVHGEYLRARYALAVQHLAAQLPRSDVALAQTARVDLTKLAAAPVLMVPGLTVRIPHPAGDVVVAVRAHIAHDPLAWLVADDEAGGADDGAGLAIARLFEGDRQKVAWAWAAMWNAAALNTVTAKAPVLSRPILSGPDSLESLVLSAPERSRERAATATGTTAIPSEPSAKVGGGTAAPDGGGAAEPRRLKSPDTLVIAEAGLLAPGREPAGVIVPRRRGLRELSSVPRRSSQPRIEPELPVAYDGVAREQLALSVLRIVLDAADKDLADMTALRGIGADALDKVNRPFELKAYAQEMPDSVTLTANEAQRADLTPGFCLVVVSGLEEGQHTRVVIVVDPLRTLPLRFAGDVVLAGLLARSRTIPPKSGGRAADRN